MPDAVRDGYQSYTCAELSSLRRAGYRASFQSLAAKVPQYVRQLDAAAWPASDHARAAH
jgi:ADP-L-glycero-D-manno-heptose 6-epimerase